jgi:2',3'-cyclic-nucleotide 2'-phosphodiesterase/3'-nucleotidase
MRGFRDEMARGHRLTRAYCDRPLGQSHVPLETFFSFLAPCAATQLIADAQRAAVAPILAGDPALAGLPLLSCTTPYKAGGRGGPMAYTNVAQGAILLRHAADLYPYSNGLAVLRATGAQIRDWLERAVSAFCQIVPGAAGPQPLLDPAFASYNFDRLDGVSYRIDLSQPARTNAEGDEIRSGPGRIRDLRRACGRDVVDDDVFLIVTNTYRAAGGGHYPVAERCDMLYSTVHPVRDVLASHIAARQGGVTQRPALGFSFTPLGGAKLVFETGPASIQHEARARALGLVADGTSDQGFARYLLTLDRKSVV